MKGFRWTTKHMAPYARRLGLRGPGLFSPSTWAAPACGQPSLPPAGNCFSGASRPSPWPATVPRAFAVDVVGAGLGDDAGLVGAAGWREAFAREAVLHG
jgi:hypothetical protein